MSTQKRTLNTNERFHAGNFPNFKKPNVEGYFSLNCERIFDVNLTQLKYIHNPNGKGNTRYGGKVRFDLNQDVDKAIKKDENIDEKLDNVLRWILQARKSKAGSGDQKESRTEADFVCYRGLLTVLMCTPYERQEGWIICATKWKGTIYLCAKETEERRQNRILATDRQKQFMAWGYKFEQYMTKGDPICSPNTRVPVNEREELCITFQTRLNGHNLLFGAEMDGVQSETEVTNLDELRKAQFIELKTSRHIQSRKQNFNFQRYKLIKWWCQSFLVGIDTLICGFRDDGGIVHELEEFQIKDIPKMAQGLWNPCICMNFCSSFLSFVKTIVEESDAEAVWKFELQPGTEEVTVTEIPGPSELSFLPEWFTERGD